MLPVFLIALAGIFAFFCHLVFGFEGLFVSIPTAILLGLFAGILTE